MTAAEHGNEYELAAVAAAVLRGDRQSAEPGDFSEQSFIQLGGDSMRALRFVAAALDRFSARVSLAELLGDEPLAVVLSRARPARPGGSHRAPSCVPLDPVCTAFLTGPLRVELLRHSIEQTVIRHHGLHTGLRADADGAHLRTIERFHPTIAVVDAAVTEEGFPAFVRACAIERGRRPLEPTAGPPLRFLLATCPPARHALVVVAHHLLLDSWSVGLLIEEIIAHYDAGERGTALELEPRDSVPANPVLPPGMLSRPMERLAFNAGAPVTDRVAETAARLGITPFAVLLGAFGLTLARHTGSDPLPVAVPFAARHGGKLQSAMAAAAVLAVPVETEGPRTVDEYLTRVHRSVTRRLEQASCMSKPPSDRQPKACLDMHDQLVRRELTTASLDVSIEESHGGRSPFDITLLIRQARPSFTGELEYGPQVWQPEQARALLADHWAAVDALARDHDAPWPVKGPVEARRPLRPAGR